MLNIIKTKSFKITAALLALVLTVSCVLWNTTKVRAQELEINGANSQGFATYGSTRAIVNDKLVGTGDSHATMSVFITGGSQDKYNATNMKWTHDGSGWKSDGSVLHEGVTTSQKIYACAPYAEDAADGTITVNAADQTDWLVATKTDLISNFVDLEMTHALSKLVLVPTFGTEATDGIIAKVEVGGMYASGTLNIADNTWSDLGDAKATLEMVNNELLVIPMEGCTSFTITITLEDGRTFTTDISLTMVNNELLPGTQYNINLQVGQDSVNIGGITAEGWISAPGGNLETE